VREKLSLSKLIGQSLLLSSPNFPTVRGPETDSATRWLGHLPGIRETQIQSLLIR